ncbi:MAG: MBL fold metallo-hydrolase [Arenicellales bacterium]|nr:MBL fold metallo-hydrolase [Arenicellales bacterium]
MWTSKPSWKTVTVTTVIIVVIAAAIWHQHLESKKIFWSMVHVSGNRFSGDAHLLEFPNGHTVLIDTGFDRYTRRDLIPYLKKRGIDHIDQVIITHAHRNHYGGIKSLLGHLSSIDRIYFNMPPRKPCDIETWPTGCDYLHVLDTRKLIRQSQVSLLEIETGQLLFSSEDDDITLKVVYVHKGEADINDTSAVLRLVYGNISVLFTGDINQQIGKYLAQNDYALKSTIVTAPHHGVESAAPNEFLSKTNADVLMVSNSANHWLGKRGKRMRQFALNNGMRTYVTGLHGNVVVTLERNHFTIDHERAMVKDEP